MEGGSANDYDYCSGDPINCNDLDGRNHKNSGVYVLRDSQDNVVYVGQSGDLRRREREHKGDPRFKDTVFERYADGLDYKTRRGLEQYLYNAYRGSGRLLNRQSPIGPRNANWRQYTRAAEKWLARNKGQYVRITIGSSGTNFLLNDIPLGSTDLMG